MLLCTKCGYMAEAKSDNWIQREQTHYADFGVGPEPYMKDAWISCPDCGCDEIVLAQQCAHCGEYCDPNTLVLATVQYPPDEEYPEGSEEDIEVCPGCYEEHYFKEEDYT